MDEPEPKVWQFCGKLFYALRIMAETPQIITTEPQFYAAIHRQIPFSEVKRVMDQSTARIAGTLQAQGITPTGAWFTHHLERPVMGFNFEVCFPVATPIEPDGEVVPKVWPAMTVARVVHYADYAGLVGAWGALEGWMKENGQVGAGEFWEVYSVSPRDSADAAEWRTELNWPLAG